MNVFGYLNCLDYMFEINFTNLKGFEVQLVNRPRPASTIFAERVQQIFILNSRIEFYLNGSLVRSCADIKINYVRSIFQIVVFGPEPTLTLDNCEFRQPLCPLIFRYSRFELLQILGLMNTFYKKNLLSFTNDTHESLSMHLKGLKFA